MLKSAIPIARAAKLAAKKGDGAKPAWLAALTDGEDFELLFTVGSKSAVKLLDGWKREFPQVNVTVHRMLASKIPEELTLRTFELGVISFRPDPAQFRTIAVYEDGLALIVGPNHPLAGASRVSITDLGEEDFIAHNVTSPLRRKVIEAFQKYRTPLNMGIELPTIEAIKRFVAMGNGVALVPHLTVVRELETGELVRVQVEELEMRRVLRLVHRRQATLSYAARAFLRTVRTLAREQGPPFHFHVERMG